MTLSLTGECLSVDAHPRHNLALTRRQELRKLISERCSAAKVARSRSFDLNQRARANEHANALAELFLDQPGVQITTGRAFKPSL